MIKRKLGIFICLLFILVVFVSCNNGTIDRSNGWFSNKADKNIDINLVGAYKRPYGKSKAFNTITISENYLYSCFSNPGYFGGVDNSYYSGIGIFNIDDPQKSVYLGDLQEEGVGFGKICIQDNYLYVGSKKVRGKNKLKIFDISNPNLPQLVGELDKNINRLHVQGNYAYSFSYDPSPIEELIEIIDVSNKRAPQFKGRIYMGYYSKYFISNNYIYYIKKNDGKFQIIDISNPEKPKDKGSFLTGYTTVNSMHVIGSYAYVNVSNNELLVIDISNPNTPFLYKKIFSNISRIVKIHQKNNFIYIYDYYTGLKIIDISNPNFPQLSLNLDFTGNYIEEVKVFGNYAYVRCEFTNHSDEGYDNKSLIKIIDISNPKEPELKTNISINDEVYSMGIKNECIYVATNLAGIKKIDFSDPTDPIIKESIQMGGIANDVYVSDNYAYIADSYEGFKIIDISNPEIPVLKYQRKSEVVPYLINCTNNFAYVISNDSFIKKMERWLFTGISLTSKIEIIDVSNSELPETLGSISVSSLVKGIVVSGNYAYVAHGSKIYGDQTKYGKLEIIDISNPKKPESKKIITIGMGVNGISISGNYLYVAYTNYGSFESEGGLKILDISNPELPIVRSDINNIKDGAQGVAVSGNYAYIVTQVYIDEGGEDGADYFNTKFQAIDVSDPENPKLNGRILIDYRGWYFWGPFKIFVYGDYAYVVDNFGLYMKIVNIADPRNPGMTKGFKIDGNTYGVFAAEDYVYVASGGMEEMIQIYEIKD